MKHVFVINPAAGRTDRTKEIQAQIAAYAAASGADCQTVVTEYPRQASLLPARLAAGWPGEETRFYACGGDGTLNEVAAGAIGLARSAFTHYPTGTGNDFIKVFGGGESFLDLHRLVNGEETAIDYIDAGCGPALNILSVGLDARIAAGMQKYKHMPLLKGQGPYLLSTLEQLLRGIGSAYEVEVDGIRMDGRYTLILAANGQYYGGGFHPVPDADCRDGMMEVLLIREVSLLTASRVIGAYKQGRYRELPRYITHLRARELKVREGAGRPMEINMDGEIFIGEQVAARLAAGGARFILPAGRS